VSRLRLFVYGTLKRGGRFHDRFCRDAVSIERATVRGRLRFLPAGYPMIDVAVSTILAEGTADPDADVATQERLDEQAAATRIDAAAWPEVRGELMAFDDAAVRLPPIDALENFQPAAPRSLSLYRRVLVPVTRETGGSVAAWTYVNASGRRAARS
jgi:gamma-glutamylcyclotransferase (GGCT)/AIG2-like uncharacterized protein YtfP